MQRTISEIEKIESAKGRVLLNPVARDTLALTLMSLVMQALGLMLNVYITKSLGTVNVGIITLVGTFYGMAAVIGGGNVFICANRLVSNEIALKNSARIASPRKIFTYCVWYSLFLSISVCAAVFVFADDIAVSLIKLPSAVAPIRMLAMAIPLGTLSACIKGWFHAHRRIAIPAFIDCAEFIVRIIVMVFLIQFFVMREAMTPFFALALSAVISAAVNCALICLALNADKEFSKKIGVKVLEAAEKSSVGFGKFLIFALPIALNSCIITALGTANDALIPLTLRQFGETAASSLSKFGIFEAIVLPALFFPSIAAQCLACILLPEISKANAEKNFEKLRVMVKKSVFLTLYYAVLVMVVFLCFGGEIGVMFGGGELAGKVITILAPVIPLIYLEIVLEGILRGLGKYVFSTVNYVAEYVIRISIVLICVPLFGFNGIVASYIISNIMGNASRIYQLRGCFMREL